MSVRVMNWVWANSKSVGADRLVLLAIADFANDKGVEAFPSLQKIAERSAVNKRTAQRSIRELEALGELQVYLNAGPNGTHRYRVLMAAGWSGATGGDTPRGETPPPAIDHGRSDTTDGNSSRKGRSPATRNIKEPSITPQPPASGGRRPPGHCKGHTKFRKGCDRCTSDLKAATDWDRARQQERDAMTFAELDAARAAAAPMPTELRASLRAVAGGAEQ